MGGGAERAGEEAVLLTKKILDISNFDQNFYSSC